MVFGKKNKFVLCISEDRLSLAQVVDQSGRGFILGSQVVHAGKCSGDVVNWLTAALKQLNPVYLKKIKDIIISARLLRCQPLDVFVLREENFLKSALFELENIAGAQLADYKFGIYCDSSNKSKAYAFLSQKSFIDQINAALKTFKIKRTRIFPVSVMFIEEVYRQVVKSPTLFIDFGCDLVTMILRKNAETKLHAIPLAISSVVQNASRILNRQVTRDEVIDFLSMSNEVEMNPQLKEMFVLLREQLKSAVLEQIRTMSGDQKPVYVLSGDGVKLYRANEWGLEEKSYHDYFKQQVPVSFEPKVIDALEPFIPALLSTATLDSKRLSHVVNFQSEVKIVVEKKSATHIYYNFLAAMLCIAAIAQFHIQYLECSCVRENVYNRRLQREQCKLADIKKEIDAVSGLRKEKEIVLNDVRGHFIQIRAWSKFLNFLQDVFGRAGNVYLTEMVMNTTRSKAEKKKSTVVKKGGDKKSKKASEDKEKKVPVNQGINTSLKIKGELFVENSGGQKDFSVLFNQIFDDIEKYEDVESVYDIKVNTSQDGIIGFSCEIELSPKAKLLSL